MYKSFVEFSLMDFCCNKCVYCPQEPLRAAYKGPKALSYTDYATMLNKLPKSVISIAGFSEPYNNPECTNMIYLAGKQGHKVILYTSLVGMTVEDYDRLRKMYHVVGLTIHLPDNEGNTVVNITDEYKKVLRYITQRPMGPWCNQSYSVHGSAVHPDIAGIVRIPEPSFVIHDRAGCLKTDDPTVHKVHWKSGAIRCGNGFNHPEAGIVLPNGDTYLCCMDFGLKYKLGNLLEQSWAELMQSPIRKRMEEDRKTGCYDDVCRHCGEAQMHYGR